MDLTRKQVIEILEKADSTVYKEPKTKTAQALEYAISDMKKIDKIKQEIEQWHKDGTNWSDIRLMTIEEVLNGTNEKTSDRYS